MASPNIGCGLSIRLVCPGANTSCCTERLRAEQKRWDEGVGYLERETFDAFLKLPAPQRKLIREVILTFAKVHGAATS